MKVVKKESTKLYTVTSTLYRLQSLEKMTETDMRTWNGVIKTNLENSGKAKQ